MGKFEQIEKELRQSLVGADIIEQINELRWLTRCSNISSLAKDVYKTLYTARDADGVSRIAIREIGQRVRKHYYDVRKAIKELESLKLVKQYSVNGHKLLYYKFPQHELMFTKDEVNND